MPLRQGLEGRERLAVAVRAAQRQRLGKAVHQRGRIRIYAGFARGEDGLAQASK